MLQAEERYEILTEILPVKKYGCWFRLVEESDAQFIWQLRTDPVLSMHVNPVAGTPADQMSWISAYKSREKLGHEVYLISLDPGTGSKQGVNRLYNFRGDTFELGSWLYAPGEDISKSILGDINAREIGYDILGFEYCSFEVRKANKSVLRYHKGYSPDITGEDDLNYYFRLSRDTFNQYKYRYLNICGYGYNK